MSLRSTNGLLFSPPPQQPVLENKINPSIFLIIVIVAIIFFVSGLLHLLVRCLLRPAAAVRESEDADVAATALQGQLQQLFHLHDAGVDQASIDALPIFPYSAIVGKLDDPFDCAVCLCEFEPHHKLRLLPKCSHAFHADCIDTWLLAHSTCPLCRTPLLPADRCCSPILLLLESASDAPAGPNDHELETKEVKLGKFRRFRSSSNDNESSNLDQRRCFSMGTYEYVMNDVSLLQVAIKKPIAVGSRRYAASECNCHSTRRESFSVSKIWLRSKDGASEVGTGSRRAFSFRTSASHCEVNAKSAVSPRMDVEVGSCDDSAVSMGSQIEGVPSFARRTLLWLVGRHSRVGSVSSIN